MFNVHVLATTQTFCLLRLLKEKLLDWTQTEHEACDLRLRLIWAEPDQRETQARDTGNSILRPRHSRRHPSSFTLHVASSAEGSCS